MLEAPSVPFTEKRWRPCHTVQKAIENHRGIFLEWARSEKQIHLFSAFDRKHSKNALLSPILLSTREFFSRFYVTDIWKDAGFKKNRGDQPYEKYWLSKLAIELDHVRAKRVIFVGKEAKRGEIFVPGGVPYYSIPFPSQWITEERFKHHVAKLVGQIRMST